MPAELCKLTGVDEELIRNSRVIHVVDGTGKQSCEDLQISEHRLFKKKKKKARKKADPLSLISKCTIIYLQSRCGQQHVRRLDHVCGVDVVVVGHICMVMILQSHHEGDESVRWNLEGLQQLSLLQ